MTLGTRNARPEIRADADGSGGLTRSEEKRQLDREKESHKRLKDDRPGEKGREKAKNGKD